MDRPRACTPEDPLRIAVFISGTGTNMVAIDNAIKVGDLDARIELVVSSNDHAKGIAYAEEEGLETLVFVPANYDDPERVDEAIVNELKSHDVEYVIMAGYMRKVTPVLLNAYPNRVVNLHPALLPKHRGAHAIEDAFEAGDEVTGITIHFANEEYDKGPIIFQHEVPVLPDDTLEALETRIHAAEHEYYPKVIQDIAQGNVVVD